MLTIFVVISCALSTEANIIKNLPRIFNGDNARIEDYPYQVSLDYVVRGQFCGGSIISKHYVLTAAHCRAFAPNIEQLSIRAGSRFRSEGGRLHKVEKFVSHEGYNLEEYKEYPIHDIAIVKVSEPFEYDDTCQPIKLSEADEEATPGAKAVVTGFGYMSNYERATQLQVVVLEIVSKGVCEKAHGILPKNQICALGENGRDACTGDSGGPIAVNNRLAGIVSWGDLCGDNRFPSVYTEVAQYRDWINKHVQFD